MLDNKVCKYFISISRLAVSKYVKAKYSDTVCLIFTAGDMYKMTHNKTQIVHHVSNINDMIVMSVM